VCKGHIVQSEMLHTQEELGEMAALEEPGSSAVSCYRLVMFALCSKCMREANPSRGRMWI
jgi:hypothetical protein